MWRRQHDDDGGDDGVRGEGDEAESVHHHGREFPVHFDLVNLLVAPHLVGDVPKLAQDVLKLPCFVEAERGVGRDDGSPLLVGPAHEARITPVVGGRTAAHRLDLPDVIVYVQNIGQQRLGRAFLQFQLPHLVVHHDGLARDLLPRTVHAQDPRQPLQQHAPDLWGERQPERSVPWAVKRFIHYFKAYAQLLLRIIKFMNTFRGRYFYYKRVILFVLTFSS